MNRDIKSAAFWIMLATQVLGTLVLVGVVPEDANEQVKENVEKIIAAVFQILTALNYFMIRFRPAPKEEVPATPPENGGESDGA